MYCHLHVLPPSCTATFMYCHLHVLPPSCTATFMYCHLHVLPPSCTATFMYCHLHVLPPSCTATFMYCHPHVLPLSCTATLTRRDSVPYAALYIAPILIDTRLHSTRGQFFIRHECGACIRLRTNTSLIRMISRSAYGFSIFVITCLHTSDERVQTLYTSCI